MSDLAKEFARTREDCCKAICESLTIIDSACEEIQNAGGCSTCPLAEAKLCINEAEIYELASLGNTMLWSKFLGFANDVLNHVYLTAIGGK